MLSKDESERLRIAGQGDRDDFTRLPNPPAQGAAVRVGITVGGNLNDIQAVSLVGGPTGGTFILKGRTLPWNATAGQVQTELLIAYGVGNLTCAGGPVHVAPVVVTFKGTLLRTLVPTMTANGANLTGGLQPIEVRVEHRQRGEPAYQTLPSQVRTWYRMQEVFVTGTEVESGGATYTNGTVYFYALNLGHSIPPLGTRCLCTRVPNAYTFRY